MNEQKKIIQWFKDQIGPGRRFDSLNDMARFLGLGTTRHTKLYGFLEGADTQHKTIFEWMEKLGLYVAYPDGQMIDFEFIGKVNAKAGAGSSLEISDSLKSFYAFRKDFLQTQGIHAPQAVMMDVLGSSMEPLIMDGDTILVDTRTEMETVKDGLIYLIGFCEELLVKRLQKSARGYILRSENPRFADVFVEGDDLESLRVHGRVRWFGRVL